MADGIFSSHRLSFFHFNYPFTTLLHSNVVIVYDGILLYPEQEVESYYSSLGGRQMQPRQLRSTKFVIPGPAATVNYRLPADFARAVLARTQGEGSGSLWIDFQEEWSPYSVHILYGHRPVAAFTFINRSDDGTTEGKLVSEVPEYFEMLKRALEEFLLETRMAPA